MRKKSLTHMAVQVGLFKNDWYWSNTGQD